VNSSGCHLPLQKRAAGEGRAEGQGEKFLGRAQVGAGGDAPGIIQLFQRQSFLSTGRKWLRDGL